MFKETCRKCGAEFESSVQHKRAALCSNCKKTRSQINTQYRDRTSDTVTFYVKKGDKARLKEFAAVQGMSLNELCNAAIDLMIEKYIKEHPEEE